MLQVLLAKPQSWKENNLTENLHIFDDRNGHVGINENYDIYTIHSDTQWLPTDKKSEMCHN